MRREANRTPLLFIDRDGAKRGPGLGKSNLPSLPPVARYTLQEQAYLRLREALMSGHFVPGQAITLRAAAEALGTRRCRRFGSATALAPAKRYSGTSSNRRKDWRACCRRAKKRWACALQAVSRKGAAGCEEAPNNGRDGASHQPLAAP